MGIMLIEDEAVAKTVFAIYRISFNVTSTKMEQVTGAGHGQGMPHPHGALK